MKRYRAHYDVIVMYMYILHIKCWQPTPPLKHLVTYNQATFQCLTAFDFRDTVKSLI